MESDSISNYERLKKKRTFWYIVEFLAYFYRIIGIVSIVLFINVLTNHQDISLMSNVIYIGIFLLWIGDFLLAPLLRKKSKAVRLEFRLMEKRLFPLKQADTVALYGAMSFGNRFARKIAEDELEIEDIVNQKENNTEQV